jgi:hypothetical protein
LISLNFSADIHLFQNEVYHLDAEVAKGYWAVIQSPEAIGSQNSSLWEQIEIAFSMAMTGKKCLSQYCRGFLFGGTCPFGCRNIQ